MWKNYLKLALRFMAKQRQHTFINILGLSIGISFTILIFLFVSDELSFDRFHEKKDNIYRVLSAFHEPDGSIRNMGPSCPLVVGPMLQESFPEVKTMVRLSRSYGVVRYEDKLFRERIYFTDQNFFEMFTFPLQSGNADQVLKGRESVVLTKSMAQKYFGDESAVGKTMSVSFGNKSVDVMVSGIAQDVPKNSTIQFDILLRIDLFPLARGEKALTSLGDFSYPIFLEFYSPNDAVSVQDQLPQFTGKVFEAFFARIDEGRFKDKDIDPVSLHLQSLSDMHLDSRTWDSSDPKRIYLLAGIAFIVLLIAGINYVNLSIARSSVRSKEIGMRKVIGAAKRQLLFQLWTESWIIVAISLLLGVVFAILFLPTFNLLIEKELVYQDLFTPLRILFLFVLSLVITAGAGSYPAWVMSRFQPITILKGHLQFQKNHWLFKTLLILQFGFSIFLLICVLVISQQIGYMVNKPLGFSAEGVIAISTQHSEEESQRIASLFEQQLANQPSFISFGAVNNSFGKGRSQYPAKIAGKKIDIYQYRVNPGYIPTIGLNIIQGRNFSQNIASDTMATIINQSLAQELGFDVPIGRTIDDPSRGYPYYLRIIGIVEDYHFDSMHRGINPALLHMQPDWGLNNLIIRVANNHISKSLKLLEETWYSIIPEKPFLYSFLNDDIEQQYRDEQRWQTLVKFSSIAAILITCMGIFGFTGITLQRRVKEIGIRKVLGASVTRVTLRLNREFFLVLLISNIPAWIIGYIAMNRLLENYHYRISLSPVYFLIATSIILVVGLVTISSLTVKAALTNPANSLRDE